MPTVVSWRPASRTCACACASACARQGSAHTKTIVNRVPPRATSKSSATLGVAYLPRPTGAAHGTQCTSVRPSRNERKGVRCAVCGQGVSGARKAVDPPKQPYRTSPRLQHRIAASQKYPPVKKLYYSLQLFGSLETHSKKSNAITNYGFT